MIISDSVAGAANVVASANAARVLQGLRNVPMDPVVRRVYDGLVLAHAESSNSPSSSQPVSPCSERWRVSAWCAAVRAP